ncbi:sodium/hydrogen exchanger 3-like isoform X2 [Convolutriloba macropyga]|uniref:sodium/hydrogen exchanger 3-like isoform X2 n=1 Tax=Convolutriloba macropyga TaxID=536237 RepID=UPI003F51C22B
MMVGINDSGLHPNGSSGGAHSEEDHESFHLVSMQFSEVKVPFFVTVFLLVASVMKTVFHLSSKITKIVPESCLLVTLGVVASLIFYYALGADEKDYNLNSETFFFILLPPVVFDAGYFMPNRAFFQNLGTILMYAVIGTIWNTALIGLLLWGCDSWGFFENELGMLPIFTFAALISAVDPVAVLAVFEEIHVNEVLHILVFGESLLNDAVTVVIYHMMESFTKIGADNLQATDILAGVASFFFVSIGGTLIGVIFGLITAFVSKFTDHVRVIEPLFVFAFSYLSYICAEIFHFSGILAIVFCGITMAQYVEENISQKSHTTIKYFLKMMSSVSEAIIFLFLGLSTSEALRHLDYLFVLIALFACLVFRFSGVYLLTAIANKFRVEKLNKSQQFIMAYGGIRGGVAFCLAVLLDADHFGEEVKGVFVSTTILVVFFTVFIQGISIKPLVQVFRIKTQNSTKLNIFETMADRVVDHVMSGIEDVSGRRGQNWLRVHYEWFNNTYLRKALLREKPKTSELNMMRAFSKLNLQETMNFVQNHQNVFLTPSVSQNSLSNYMRKEFEKYENLGKQGQQNHINGELGYPGFSETCLDMRPISRQNLPNQKMLEDAETHRATMETAFQRRSKGIVSGAQIKFTNPRHAIPSSRVINEVVTHHMQNYTALSHHMINSRIHKKSMGGSYNDQNGTHNPASRPSVLLFSKRKNVSFILPTPNVEDLDKYLHSGHNHHVPPVAGGDATFDKGGMLHAGSNGNGNNRKISAESSDGHNHNGHNHKLSNGVKKVSGVGPGPLVTMFKRNASCDEYSEDDGITFSVPSVQNSDVKIKVYDEEKVASSCSHSGEEGSGGHSGEGGSDSESIPCSQSPVAIESYLPWKDSLDFETPNVTFGFEEAPQSQHVLLPPGQDKTLEEWDNELPESIRHQLDLAAAAGGGAAMGGIARKKQRSSKARSRRHHKEKERVRDGSNSRHSKTKEASNSKSPAARKRKNATPSLVSDNSASGLQNTAANTSDNLSPLSKEDLRLTADASSIGKSESVQIDIGSEFEPPLQLNLDLDSEIDKTRKVNNTSRSSSGASEMN